MLITSGACRVMYGYGYYGSRANEQTFSLGRLLDSDTMEDNAPSRRELIMHAAVDCFRSYIGLIGLKEEAAPLSPCRRCHDVVARVRYRRRQRSRAVSRQDRSSAGSCCCPPPLLPRPPPTDAPPEA